MKNKKFIISSLIISSLVISNTSLANTVDEIQEEKSKLVDETQNIKNENLNTQKEINVLNNQISQTEKELFTIESDITDLTIKINKLNDEISVLEAQIIEKEQKIKELTIDLNEKKAILKEHLVNMYTGGGKLTIIEMIVRSESIGDLFKRIDIYKEISNKAVELNKEIEETILMIDSQKIELEHAKKELVTSKSDLESNKTIFLSKQTEKETLVSKLHSEKEQHEHDLDEQENALASISKEISAMEAQIQAKIDEEKRKINEQNTSSKPSTSKPSTSKPTLQTSGTLGLPIAKGQYYISSGYGYRTDPVYGGRRLHSGTDFAAPHGTPIHSVESGYVLFSGPTAGFGHWIVIKHDNGLYSVYGHMYSNQLYVNPGDRVERGQHIAAVGSDGKSTGPHLHLCIATSYVNGKFTYVDPMIYY